MTTLADAIESGEGVERPFRCEAHDDHSASASVNVLKGVWYCFACHAKGTTDGKNKPPSLEALESMLRPEKAARTHPLAYLELFRNDLGVWPERFPDWVRGLNDLGCDPFTGDATFPVHTAKGLFAGIGRRRADPEAQPRYVYPPSWSASRSLFQPRLTTNAPREVLVLVEGAADASAVAEIGCPSAAVYGSGLHRPQMELIKRSHPKLVVLGFDADSAGERGRRNAEATLDGVVDQIGVTWNSAGGKDPAALIPEVRHELLADTVGAAGYRDATRTWPENVQESRSLWRHLQEVR